MKAIKAIPADEKRGLIRLALAWAGAVLLWAGFGFYVGVTIATYILERGV